MTARPKRAARARTWERWALVSDSGLPCHIAYMRERLACPVHISAAHHEVIRVTIAEQRPARRRKGRK